MINDELTLNRESLNFGLYVKIIPQTG